MGAHDEPNGSGPHQTIVFGPSGPPSYGKSNGHYSSTEVPDDKLLEARNSCSSPRIVILPRREEEKLKEPDDEPLDARYICSFPHYYRRPRREVDIIKEESEAREPNCPPRPHFRRVTGYGFTRVPQRTEPQCIIGHGRYNKHNDFEIDNKPDGLNSMLEAEDSPSKLLITKVPTVIIGMGVSHDLCPGDYDIPSIAAVVHSKKWPQISEYRAYVQTQPPKAETIDSLYKPVRECDGKIRDSGIMRELLQDFYDSSGKRKPEQIIIFRYGDSELQLTQVLNAEVDQIMEACKCFDEKWSPKFLVIKFFNHGVPDSGPSGTIKDDKVLDDFREYLLIEGDMIDGTMPMQYRVELDHIGLNAEDLQHLVESLTYVHQLRLFAVSSVACFWFGIKRNPKAKTKRIKADKVNLQREREFIKRGEEVALYALGHLNAETGGRYKFERHLFDQYEGCRFDAPVKKHWQHVSMFAEDNESQKKIIIFAELCYLVSDGKYESIVHCILDPNDHAGIMYGCGFCYPSYAGPHISPHPADLSKFVAGHG